MAQKITLYGHAACAQVGPVKGVLSKAGVDYDYVNIRTDPDAAALVRDINDGFESVPTLVFPDGTTLTEPSYGQLANKLKALGYTLSPYAWLTGNFWLIVLAIGILFAALRMFGVF